MLDFDVEQLRAFEAVARAGSFRAAAENIGAAQSSVSQQIARLEGRLGHRLFDRTTRSVELTTDGRGFRAYARAILALAEDARRHFERPPTEGVIRLGIVEDFALSELNRVLTLFRADHPRFALTLRTGLSARLLRGLDDGDLDVVLAKRLPGRETGRLIFDAPLVWCGDARLLEAHDIAVPVVTYPEPSETRALIEIALRRAHRPFAVVAESEGIVGIQAAVTAGFGFAAFSDLFIPHGLSVITGGTLLPPLDAIEYIVDKRALPANEAVDAFIDLLVGAATAVSKR